MKLNFKPLVLKVAVLSLPLLVCLQSVFGQEVMISGLVVDGESLEPVRCNIYLNNKDINLSSSEKGFFALKLQNGERAVLDFSHPNYHKEKISFIVNQDSMLQIQLAPIVLDEVVAKSNVSEHNISDGRIRFNLERLKSMPAVMGEPDLMKSITLLPGLAGGQEGTSNLWIRGGTPDQNLLLYENATIFNPSHLLGFVSVFNPDAIGAVDVYKGNFPARYGARLSGVVDVKSKNNFPEKAESSLSIGLLSSRAHYHKTLIPQKLSFSAAARSTYLSLPLLPVLALYNNRSIDNYFNYWMVDFNLGVRWNITPNHSLILSIYEGTDHLKSMERIDIDEESRFKLSWGNTLASLNHYGLLLGKFEVQNTLAYSRYRFGSSLAERNLIDKNWITFFINTARIHNLKAKSKWLLNDSENFKVNSGIEFNTYTPEQEGGGLIDSVGSISKIPTLLDHALFVDLDLKIAERISLISGLRAVNYLSNSNSFFFLEPRLSFELRSFDRSNMFTLGLSRMTQPLHLLNSTFGLPNDIWLTANEQIPPSTAWQLNGGLSKQFKVNNLFLSLEGYYKRTENLTDYAEGFVFEGLVSGTLDELLENRGQGRSLGVELYAKMESKKWNWEIAYTLSNSQFRFPTINEGLFYPSPFDRRHDVSLSFNLALSSKWTLNSTWTLQSGRPYTFPEAISTDPSGRPFVIYGERNNKRLPAYHRLDLGFSYSYRKKQRAREISFGLINAYNRQNPFVILPETGFSAEGFNLNFSQRSLIPILPYLTYTINLSKKK